MASLLPTAPRRARHNTGPTIHTLALRSPPAPSPALRRYRLMRRAALRPAAGPPCHGPPRTGGKTELPIGARGYPQPHCFLPCRPSFGLHAPPGRRTRSTVLRPCDGHSKPRPPPNSPCRGAHPRSVRVWRAATRVAAATAHRGPFPNRHQAPLDTGFASRSKLARRPGPPGRALPVSQHGLPAQHTALPSGLCRVALRGARASTFHHAQDTGCAG
jgi:hypothetical protein